MTHTSPQPHLPRSLSQGHNLNGKHQLLHNMRHTHSLPGSFPATRPWGQRQRALTGLTTIRPSPPQSRPSQPAPPPQEPANLPLGGVPMERTGWGRERRMTRPRAAPRAHTSAMVRPRLNVGLGIQLAGSFQHIPRPRGGEEDFTNNGGLEGIDGDEELPAYSVHPPRLSHVQWPSPAPAGPASQHGAAPPSYTSGRGESIIPPGAPLLPPVSRFGSHHHHPGVDHRPGGVADDDALIRRGPLLTPARPTWSRSYTSTMRSGRALPAMSRFATGPLAH